MPYEKPASSRGTLCTSGSTSWNGRIEINIGIFGGTFDPPHIGHLILAAESHYQLKLDHLLWVLTPDPPHKLGQYITPLPHRLDMVMAAIGGDPIFELSRIDIDRPPPHFAVDTVRLVGEIYPQARRYYLMGGDSLHDLPNWVMPAEFLEACNYIGVMRRPGDRVDLTTLERRLPGVTAKTVFIEAPLLEIAASEIRQRVNNSEPYRYYVTAPVYDIIRERGLYKELTTREQT